MAWPSSLIIKMVLVMLKKLVLSVANNIPIISFFLCQVERLMRILTGVGHICGVEVNSLGVNIFNHHQTLKH